MTIVVCEGFDLYEPKSQRVRDVWPKDMLKPNSKTPYSFTRHDGVSISGEFKGERWVVRFTAPGYEPIEVLFNQPPTFVANW